MKLKLAILWQLMRRWITLLMIVFIIIIPVIIKQLCDINLWVSFLGGYFGGVITLVGVAITIVNLNNENAKTNELNKQQNFDNRRLSILPFLLYDFVNKEMPECYRDIPVGVDYEDIDSNNPRIACTMSIKNCGAGQAYDVFYRMYVGDKSSYDTEKITDVLLVSSKTYDRDFVFTLPKIENLNLGHNYFDIWLVLFYKDLMRNQYVQEIPGNVSIFKADTDKLTTNINFFEPLPSKTDFDEMNYTFQKTKSSEEKLNVYKERYNLKYKSSPDDKSSDELLIIIEPLLQLFYEFLVLQAKEMLGIPHLEMGKGGLVGFNKLGDEKLEMVSYEKRGFTIDKSITYFLTIKLDLQDNKMSLTNIDICENTLVEDNSTIRKFNFAVKKSKRKINRNL